MFKVRPPGVVTRHAVTTSAIDIEAADRNHYRLTSANPVEQERPQHA
jgi:hypothetical protein